MRRFSSRNGASAQGQASTDGDDDSTPGISVSDQQYTDVFNLLAILHRNPVHRLAIETFERNHLEIMRLSRQPDIDLRGVARLMGVASEQMLQTFSAASATANGYMNHIKYSRFYSAELQLAQEQYDFLSDDYRLNKKKFAEVNKQLEAVNKQLEAMQKRAEEAEKEASREKHRVDALFQWAQQNGMTFP